MGSHERMLSELWQKTAYGEEWKTQHMRVVLCTWSCQRLTRIWPSTFSFDVLVSPLPRSPVTLDSAGVRMRACSRACDDGSKPEVL